jgi:hypothetical protein
VSEAIVSILSNEIKHFCREVDRVTVKGSIEPIRLYTIDLVLDDLEPKVDRFNGMSIKEKKGLRDKEKKALLHKVLETK